ncbi:hypothetical protein C8R46DRAFT_1113918 [Mycena filopes]|nr:hypothetical protein C8R46DRAFT_1113918 [Mycena filopes]
MSNSLDSTYGVAFVTLFLSTILYGMGMLQAFLYFHWYPKDRWTLKTLVLIVVVFETLQSALFLAGMYLNLVTNFGNPAGLDVLSWQDSAQLLFGYLSGFIVQMYFGYCIRVLNPRDKIVPGLIWVLGLVSLGAAIAQTVRTTQLGHFSRLDVTKPIMTTQSASLLACDVVITTALIYSMRGKMGDIKSTNSMLTTLMVNAVSRGFLTAVCALLNLILFLVKPNTFYFFIGLILSSKLYMNSLLATLNTRNHVRNKGRAVTAQGWNSIALSPVSGSGSAEASGGRDIPRSNPGVGIVFQHTTADSETDAKRGYDVA